MDKLKLLSWNDETHFWLKVDVGDNDTCWDWIALTGKDGYGLFWTHHRKLYHAHRCSWYFTNGIPKGQINHRCNNRICCNPEHAYDGTQRQNVDDAKRAGSYKGKNSPLTAGDHRIILHSLVPQKTLAKIYKVSQGHISNIKNRKVKDPY